MSTAALFERLAPRYDELWTETAIGRAQRDAVWRVTDKLFCAGDRVLDVGCGTGEDAAHLVGRGISVRAVDASPAMVVRARARGVSAEVLDVGQVGSLRDLEGTRGNPSPERRLPASAQDAIMSALRVAPARGMKTRAGRLPIGRRMPSGPTVPYKKLDGAITDLRLAGETTCPVTIGPGATLGDSLEGMERRTLAATGQAKACPTTELRGARLSLPNLFFDGVISNFGALNCVEDIASVARALGALVRPGGHVAICTMGRFCLWETLYYAARFRFKKALRRISGRAGDVYYPTVRQLRADFSADFELLYWTGIGMLVPPSYVKLPTSVVHLLARLDRLPFLRACADHRLLVFRRK